MTATLYESALVTATGHPDLPALSEHDSFVPFNPLEHKKSRATIFHAPAVFKGNSSRPVSVHPQRRIYLYRYHALNIFSDVKKISV